MDDVARLAARDRRDLFTTAAARRSNLSRAIIEKDFWVCWALRRVFALQPFSSALIFKGGTSLSKVYGAIQRFSEDVDLSIDRAKLGFSGERDPAKAPSRKKAQRRIQELGVQCRKVIGEQFMPMLQSECERALAIPAGGQWQIGLDREDPDQQTILFEYPTDSSEQAGQRFSYIRPMVRLELGARSDHWPSEEHDIMPYAAETFPGTFKDAQVAVRVLAAERTFWEKATILHAWCHAPATKRIPARQSRHYYDLVTLYRSRIGSMALENLNLLEAVANHKKLFFPSAWAKYNDARAGSLRLVPPNSRRPELEQDYREMAEMFFEDSPTFEEICVVLGEIEQAVNSLSR